MSTENNKDTKKKNFILSILKWILSTMRRWWKTSIIITILIALVLYFTIINIQRENLAVSACEDIYKAKIQEFSKQTGIVADNVYFKSPVINKSKNLYSVIWDKSIEAGGVIDSFTCQYNFATHKALDRTE
ncbi:hypothetical protein [Francisella philomiragia]|uniref:hypothetical protein n=1 Tax=Francisella philomiragia TaxID=28110 RepID=UPI0019073EE8|nr:hypothetical protein [Francisella philomiragia]MBK2270174.1 hypothetical protein [Francisella philomiragia]MBK2275838.1 hypothetical protein [Francisella philomiragia]MBK2305051.1 hypothetical protein [Francisella philomiragia]